MRVLVTGAASGIGAATVEEFLSHGVEVYALDILSVPPREGVVPLQADVSDPAALGRVADTLAEGGVVLDVMVLVAGIHRMASLVEADQEILSRVIEVNTLGAMHTVRAFHPLLGARGRIVIVTSEVASLDPLPFNGLYSVSKTALDAYAQALRQELTLLGQTVVTVRPGAIATPLCAGSLTATESLTERTVLYRRQARHFLAITKSFMGRPLTPDKLSPLLYRVATVAHPRLTYSKHRNFGMVLLSLLPLRLQCAIIKLLLNRK